MNSLINIFICANIKISQKTVITFSIYFENDMEFQNAGFINEKNHFNFCPIFFFLPFCQKTISFINYFESLALFTYVHILGL